MSKSPYYDTAPIETAFEESCSENLQITQRLELRRLATSLWYDTEMNKQGAIQQNHNELLKALTNFKANLQRRKNASDTLTSLRLMEVPEPAVSEIALTAKVWDCAGIKSHDQRSRVLKKIDQQCEAYWVERRNGRTAVLHKGKSPNEIIHE